MTPAGILGSAPFAWDTLRSDLIRLRNEYDINDETYNASSAQTKLISYNRLLLLDAILAHIQPAVEREAQEREEDRVDEAAKRKWPG